MISVCGVAALLRCCYLAIYVMKQLRHIVRSITGCCRKSSDQSVFLDSEEEGRRGAGRGCRPAVRCSVGPAWDR